VGRVAYTEGSSPFGLSAVRKAADGWRKEGTAAALKAYPANVASATTAGVCTDTITPLNTPPENHNRVLITLHGGGFISDSASLIEGIPIANLSKTRVVSVYYRLAPENPFPAAVDDVVAVYKELLKTYQPHDIGIFATSTGAALTAEVAVLLKQLQQPLLAALGLFLVSTDFSRPGDSEQRFTLDDLPGDLSPQSPRNTRPDDYAGTTDPRDPVLSPLYADLRGMPPTRLVTSTRVLLLRGTSLFHRSRLGAGNDSQLWVFEALPHAFWYHFELPETREALELMAGFFDQKVGR
jgi:acetyl esterase/lipase